jgi:hypothetical protein
MNTTSNVIRSSLVPMASAIIAADSAKTSLSGRTLSARPSVSGDCENPIACWVSAMSIYNLDRDHNLIELSNYLDAATNA